jgi:hypothetical protein
MSTRRGHNGGREHLGRAFIPSQVGSSRSIRRVSRKVTSISFSLDRKMGLATRSGHVAVLASVLAAFRCVAWTKMASKNATQA